MKKILLAGTALLAVAAAAPAKAELTLDLGGLFRGYAVYSSDESATARDELDLRRDAEIHFTGETTLDNGLTVGVHVEEKIGNDQLLVALNSTDEVYAYFSGGWGRVNLGSEDGAAYLLQVAAPSADSNVDGLRTYIQGIDANVLEYAHADFRDTDRLTYLTPKFNGFQAGVSYATEAGQNAIGNNVVPMGVDTDAEDLWELAARWDGEFNGFGLSLGAGYSNASEVAVGQDLTTWNVGANVAFNQFSVGAAYKESDNDTAQNQTTWVVGAAWDNGPYHIGASYLAQETFADTDQDRLTLGAGYAFGPGMSFRGAVAFGEADQITAGGTPEEDFTQVTIGTDLQF